MKSNRYWEQGSFFVNTAQEKGRYRHKPWTIHRSSNLDKPVASVWFHLSSNFFSHLDDRNHSETHGYVRLNKLKSDDFLIEVALCPCDACKINPHTLNEVLTQINKGAVKPKNSTRSVKGGHDCLTMTFSKDTIEEALQTVIPSLGQYAPVNPAMKVRLMDAVRLAPSAQKCDQFANEYKSCNTFNFPRL